MAINQIQVMQSYRLLHLSFFAMMQLELKLACNEGNYSYLLKISSKKHFFKHNAKHDTIH